MFTINRLPDREEQTEKNVLEYIRKKGRNSEIQAFCINPEVMTPTVLREMVKRWPAAMKHIPRDLITGALVDAGLHSRQVDQYYRPDALLMAPRTLCTYERLLFAVKIRWDLLDLVPEFLAPDENGNYSKETKQLCLAALKAKFYKGTARHKIPSELIIQLLEKDLEAGA